MSIKVGKSVPVSGIDIVRSLDGNVNIYTYSKLAKFDSIWDLFNGVPAFVILYETRKGFGHWACVINRGGSIEHFDSYGFFPDQALKQIPEYFRKNNRMGHTHLLYLLYKSGVPIEYNDFKLQSREKDISTCGRWCIARIYFRELPIEEFAKLFLMNRKYKPDDLVTLFTSKLLGF